jgi:hypothetical protein
MKSNTWIALLAYEACVRHAADCRRNEETATRLAALHSNVLADLRCAIALHIEGFLGAGGDRSQVTLTGHNGGSARGFDVSRMEDGTRTRNLAVALEAGALSCRYDICGGSINGASDHRGLAIAIGNDGSALSLWDGGLHRTFATGEVLSAFLLAPILGDASSSASSRS